MSKKELGSLGAIYGDMLDSLKVGIIKESKVKPSQVGDATLTKGGATEGCGCIEPKVDITKVGDEEENAYNIKGLSYGDGNDPGNTEGSEPTENGAVTGAVGKKKKHDEEDEEEFSPEVEKIAQESLNNFMKRKSVFDNLYNKVMVNENYEMEETELDALGLDDATPDDELELEDDGEVTITLSKDLAQQLHDVLMSVLEGGDAGEEEYGEEEYGEEEYGEEEYGEEDEEGAPTAFNTHYDDGKHNKVGSVKPSSRKADGSTKARIDHGSQLKTHYNDGKSNKVGNLKSGQGAFE